MAYVVVSRSKFNPRAKAVKLPVVYATEAEAREAAEKQAADRITGARFAFTVEKA